MSSLTGKQFYGDCRRIIISNSVFPASGIVWRDFHDNMYDVVHDFFTVGNGQEQITSEIFTRHMKQKIIFIQANTSLHGEACSNGQSRLTRAVIELDFDHLGTKLRSEINMQVCAINSADRSSLFISAASVCNILCLHREEDISQWVLARIRFLWRQGTLARATY